MLHEYKINSNSDTTSPNLFLHKTKPIFKLILDEIIYLCRNWHTFDTVQIQVQNYVHDFSEYTHICMYMRTRTLNLKLLLWWLFRNKPVLASLSIASAFTSSVFFRQQFKQGIFYDNSHRTKCPIHETTDPVLNFGLQLPSLSSSFQVQYAVRKFKH